MQSLSFRSKEEKLEIQKLGLEQLENGIVSEEALLLGNKYKDIIESHDLPKMSIRLINENVGNGVFAEEPLEKGSYIGEYTGVVRENTRIYFVPLNNYLMEYPALDELGRNLVVDAENGNSCRFINHSTEPNLKAHYAFIDGFYHILLFALRKIEIGEQLTHDYGANYWVLRSAPEKLE